MLLTYSTFCSGTLSSSPQHMEYMLLVNLSVYCSTFVMCPGQAMWRVYTCIWMILRVLGPRSIEFRESFSGLLSLHHA